METQDNLNDLRVPSFSCYLNPIEGVVNVFEGGEKFSDMAVLDLHTVKPNLFTARSPSQAKSSGKRWFHAYARPCSTRKAVYVDQSIKHVDQFTFPVLNPAMDDLPRMSLEVFESGTVKKDEIARHLVRKMSILTWDAIPKSVICEDMASEASSDLFEIDNIKNTCFTTRSPRSKSRSSDQQKRSQKTLGTGVLGCKSYKSVNVAEPVYRTTDKAKR